MSFTCVSTWSCLPRTQRGQPIVLGIDSKGKKLLYAHGNSVIIRDIEDPAISDIYTEHSTLVNVAKYAPSGYYICSGDQHGKVRIWDTVNVEHILKAEYQPLGGPIRDIAWSQDSQRICVVGEGKGKFAHVFMVDTGVSVKGDISGHTKFINSCDWKPTRPFRIVTGSEDNKIAFYDGPPFQFKCTVSDHQKFVQCVRYAPNGERYASGGFDGRVFVYDGKTSDLLKEMGSPAHKGGVYGVSWSPDSNQILSASGDKSCKLWNADTGECMTHFTFGNEVEDQQISCIWTPGNQLISVSLSGFLNYLDVGNPSKPIRVIQGHNKPITRLGLTSNCSTLYTTATDGTAIVWDIASGLCSRIEGKGHGSQINALLVTDTEIYTAGIDDAIRIIDPVHKCFTGESVSLSSQPKDMAPLEDGVIVVTLKEVCIVKGNQKQASFPLSFDGICVAVNKGSTEVAVGGGDNKVHMYQLSGNTLTEMSTLEHLGPVTDVAFSPDRRYLAACDANRKVVIYNVPGFDRFNKIEWGFHNARINCLAWSPNGRLVASGSLDTMIIIWSLDQPNKHIIIKNSHPQSQITGLVWVFEDKLISCGHDAVVKSWHIQF